MESDDFWRFAVVEMALDGIATKVLQRFGFCKDGLAKCSRCVSALRRLFHKKYQFVHFVRANRPLVFCPQYRQFAALYQESLRACLKNVAADVRRRRDAWISAENPPPYVVGYETCAFFRHALRQLRLPRV
jgi:hypothetical protein